jgi:hypothetical protein
MFIWLLALRVGSRKRASHAIAIQYHDRRQPLSLAAAGLALNAPTIHTMPNVTQLIGTTHLATALTCLFSCTTLESVALSIHVRGFDDDGVKLIPPTTDDFDALARPLIGRVADIGLKLKPMLVVVSNESPRTIVSFSKIWKVRHKDRRTTSIRSHTSFPEFLCGDAFLRRDSQALPPGGQRIEAANLVIQGYAADEPYYDQFLDQFIVEKDRMLANASELHIEVDAVIFDDGTLIGHDPDGWLRGLFSEYVAAKQQWYRQILERLDAGLSVEDAYAPIRAFHAERRTRVRRPRRPGEHLEIWKTNAAAEATRWRNHFNDDELPALLRESIRLDPFVIRRRDAT